MENSKILETVDILNTNNWKILAFDNMLKNDTKGIIKKIILVNLYKYNFSFLNNEKYFLDNIDFIQSNILNGKLTTTNFEKLYINLLKKFFSDKNIGYRTRIKRNMSANNDMGKIGQVYTNYNNIIKELNILMNNYNNNLSEHTLTRLYKLIINTLSNIHPFSDNNFGIISLLFDLLLIKHSYLPIGIKKTFKDNKIFLPSELDFYKIIEARYKNYNY